MLKLESAAQRLGAGYLDERTHFDPTSSLSRLGVAFNQMADNVSMLIASKKLLIDELLTYARLDRPQVALNIEPLDLLKWLEDKVEDIRFIHPERDILLDIPHIGNYDGPDIRLMERVLDNLVNNALRY